jgi:hypothetical protein
VAQLRTCIIRMLRDNLAFPARLVESEMALAGRREDNSAMPIWVPFCLKSSLAADPATALRMLAREKARYEGPLSPPPAYEMICEANGGYGEKVENPEGALPALQRALRVVREERYSPVCYLGNRYPPSDSLSGNDRNNLPFGCDGDGPDKRRPEPTGCRIEPHFTVCHGSIRADLMPHYTRYASTAERPRTA